MRLTKLTEIVAEEMDEYTGTRCRWVTFFSWERDNRDKQVNGGYGRR